VTQPPPPYLYEDPPKVNKWIEDELNETKVPLDNQRPPSSGSGGSKDLFLRICKVEIFRTLKMHVHFWVHRIKLL
jgi:hypothetical protein